MHHILMRKVSPNLRGRGSFVSVCCVLALALAVSGCCHSRDAAVYPLVHESTGEEVSKAKVKKAIETFISTKSIEGLAELGLALFPEILDAVYNQMSNGNLNMFQKLQEVVGQINFGDEATEEDNELRELVRMLRKETKTERRLILAFLILEYSPISSRYGPPTWFDEAEKAVNERSLSIWLRAVASGFAVEARIYYYVPADFVAELLEHESPVLKEGGMPYFKLSGPFFGVPKATGKISTPNSKVMDKLLAILKDSDTDFPDRVTAFEALSNYYVRYIPELRGDIEKFLRKNLPRVVETFEKLNSRYKSKTYEDVLRDVFKSQGYTIDNFYSIKGIDTLISAYSDPKLGPWVAEIVPRLIGIITKIPDWKDFVSDWKKIKECCSSYDEIVRSVIDREYFGEPISEEDQADGYDMSMPLLGFGFIFEYIEAPRLEELYRDTEVEEDPEKVKSLSREMATWWESNREKVRVKRVPLPWFVIRKE